MKIIWEILILLVVLLSCSATKERKSNFPGKPETFNISVLQDSNSYYFIHYIDLNNYDSAKYHSFINNLKSIELKVISDDSVISSQLLDINFLKNVNPKKEAYVYLLGKYNSPELKNCQFDFIFNTQQSQLFYTVLHPINKNEEQYARECTCFPLVNKLSERTFQFTLFTTRNFTDRESIASTEKLRVEIVDKNGKQVWASNRKAKYLQMITFVQPEKVGEFYRYNLIWNCTNNANNPVEEGTYNVVITIPSLPKPYISKHKIKI